MWICPLYTGNLANAWHSFVRVAEFSLQFVSIRRHIVDVDDDPPVYVPYKGHHIQLHNKMHRVYCMWMIDDV